MPMITHSSTTSPNNSFPPSYHPTALLHTGNHDEAQYRAWRNAVYEELELAGMSLLAWDWLNCSTSYATFELSQTNPTIANNVRGVYVCTDVPGHYAKAVCFTCHCRACPDCARRETARLLNRYMPLVEQLSSQQSELYGFKHIVLTTSLDLMSPHIRDDIQFLSESALATMDFLLPHDWRKSQGFLISCEFGTDGKKLHFHLFFYGKYIKQKELSETWEYFSAGAGKVVRIYAIKDKDATYKLKEQVKYVTKFWSKDEETNEVKYFEPDLMPVLIKALVGIRRVKSYGILYKVKSEPRAAKCPHCEFPLIRWNPNEFSIFVQTGFSPVEQAILLSLKHGNNFFSPVQEKSISDPAQVPKQEELFNVGYTYL